MSQHHGIDAPGRDRKGLPVPFAKLLEPLEEAGIDQYLCRTGIEQVLGAGDRLSCAEKRYRCHELPVHAKRLTCPPVCQKRTVWSSRNSPVRMRAIRPAIALAV